MSNACTALVGRGSHSWAAVPGTTYDRNGDPNDMTCRNCGIRISDPAPTGNLVRDTNLAANTPAGHVVPPTIPRRHRLDEGTRPPPCPPGGGPSVRPTAHHIGNATTDNRPSRDAAPPYFARTASLRSVLRRRRHNFPAGRLDGAPPAITLQIKLPPAVSCRVPAGNLPRRGASVTIATPTGDRCPATAPAATTIASSSSPSPWYLAAPAPGLPRSGPAGRATRRCLFRPGSAPPKPTVP